MKLIPTPYRYERSETTAPIDGFSAIHCDFPKTPAIGWGLEELRRVYAETPTGAALTIERSDDPFFDEKNAAGQGYILHRDGDRLTLAAQGPAGVLYGLMTLCQMADDMPQTFTIHDRPQVRFRGNMNTLWAETAVWTYDFGDGIEAAKARLFQALDDAAHCKLNLMYIDAFGFRTERFPGYDALMHELSAYAAARCVRLMNGAYGMGYGLAAHDGGKSFMGKVFRNRWPYPDGELYDCIGSFELHHTEISHMKGRSYGTCLSNDGLTDDKIAEMREYIEKTGVNSFYLHNMDSPDMGELMWQARCAHCRERFPSDDLFAADGMAGAFAHFYDRMIDGLLPVCPDLLIAPVAPGYSYNSSPDSSFNKSRRFWAAVLANMRHASHLCPTFRELFYQHEEPVLRFDRLRESLGRHQLGCVYFYGGDGFYTDLGFAPGAAFTYTMREADLIVCANGGALQKPAQYANAEYFWNPDNSAFYNVPRTDNRAELLTLYDALRKGKLRPEGIYGPEGLLETACMHIFGKAGKRLAGLWQMYGAEGAQVVFTPSCVELITDGRRRPFPITWEEPLEVKYQRELRARYAESALVTQDAADLLTGLLDAVRPEDAAYLIFMRDLLRDNAVLCRLLRRYMDLYLLADRYFSDGTALPGDFTANAESLICDAEGHLADLQARGRRPFDPMGGVLFRQEELFDFLAYSARMILDSLRENARIPSTRRARIVRDWW